MPADLYGREVKRRKQSDPKASSISSSSFLSLKAELAKHQSTSSSGSNNGSSSRPIGIGEDPASSGQRDEYSLPSSSSSKRRGEAGDTFLLSGSFGKPNRKLPAHLRPSPSTALRATKDTSSPSYPSSSSSSSGAKGKKRAEGGSYTLSSWSSTPSAQLERDRNLVLERKAKLYDQLKRGLSGGVEEEDLRDEGRLGGLVDWERKIEEGGSGSESESDQGGEDGGGEGEEMIEFQDELGRTRRLPRSQVPMAQLIEMKRREEETGAANIPLLHGPQQHFPILTTTNSSASRHLDEDAPPPEQHFDASAEVRNRGAGFYRFTAGNEEERRRQMAGLKEERERTLRERERIERGGKDGQGEGDSGGGGEGNSPPEGSVAHSPGLALGGTPLKLTKGERRLAERRELIEARRRELAAAKQQSGGQEERDTSSTAGQGNDADASGGKLTPDQHKDKQSAVDGEEERRKRERERQQRAIDHFLDEVDEEYRSRQQA